MLGSARSAFRQWEVPRGECYFKSIKDEFARIHHTLQEVK